MSRRPHGFVPIPNYWRMCGWCGKQQIFGHCNNMLVCGVCGR